MPHGYCKNCGETYHGCALVHGDDTCDCGGIIQISEYHDLELEETE